MDLTKIKPPFWLFMVILFVSVTTAFDLNMEPADEEMAEAETPTTNNNNNNAAAAVAKPQPSQKVAAFYNKIQKLFKTLEICDTDNLNFQTLQIPKEFSSESKAMMALEKVAKSNLIPKKDKARYKRIMQNCSKISEIINARKESLMSLDSQTSGGNYEDRLARQMYEMKNSVLDGLRDRFARLDISKSPEYKMAPTKPSPIHTNPTRIEDTAPVARLETAPMDIQIDSGSQQKFFTFF